MAIPVQGRIYITENYLCFHAAVPPIDVCCALDDVRAVKRFSVLYVSPTGIEIQMKDDTSVSC